ncbi:MAG: nucleoside 2-deoxyribosyltransferase [Candidatus Woesearchaeota archaeon]
MKIYFAGSIRAGREDSLIYKEIISYLKKFGQVLTEHFGDDTIVKEIGENLSDRKIHDIDMDWLLESDILVAEVTRPSLGVGYEIGRAVEHNKRILCLYRPNDVKKLSAMIAGSSGVKTLSYNDMGEAKKHIEKFFQE